MAHLAGQSLAGLPWTSREYIATNLNELEADHIASLLSQMNELIQNGTIAEAGAEKYINFVNAVPISAWESGPLQAHVKPLLARVGAMVGQPEFLSAYFPAARKLLGFAPTGRAGAFLKGLFEQAASVPAVYPIIHREMIGAWPEEDEQIGQYDATAVAQRAIQFIKENLAVKDIGDVFASVADLIDKGLAADSLRPQVANAAIILWPHAPFSVLSCINKISGFLSPADMKNLITGKQPADQNTEALHQIVQFVAAEQDEEHCRLIAEEILSTPPIPIDDWPDGALTIWLSAIRSNEAPVLGKLLTDETLNDDQRERLVYYAVIRKDLLGLPFFADVAPQTLTQPTGPKAAAALISKMDEIVGLALTRDQKSSLAEALVPTMPSLANVSLDKVARIIRQIGGRGILERDSATIEKFDADQMEIILREMPDSRVLSRHAVKLAGPSPINGGE